MASITLDAWGMEAGLTIYRTWQEGGHIYNWATPAWEDRDEDQWDSYDVPLDEDAEFPGHYSATVDDAGADRSFMQIDQLQMGDSPSATDPVVGMAFFDKTITDAKTAAEAAEVQTDKLHFTGDDVKATLDGEKVALSGSALGRGPTASRSRTDGYYTCPQGGTIGLYRRILGWDGADLQQADVQSITYSIFALSDDDPSERTAVEGHEDVVMDKTAVLFDEVQSDEWASDYNFKHIPDISTNQAFPEADTHYLVEYWLTPTSGQVMVERIKVRAI